MPPLKFCPWCGNLLELSTGQDSCMQFACVSCPYKFRVTERISRRIYPRRKELDDVMGGAEAWQNVDATDVPCPKCNHQRAYFRELQTRSADEPMTIFYKCCSEPCGYLWKE